MLTIYRVSPVFLSVVFQFGLGFRPRRFPCFLLARYTNSGRRRYYRLEVSLAGRRVHASQNWRTVQDVDLTDYY